MCRSVDQVMKIFFRWMTGGWDNLSFMRKILIGLPAEIRRSRENMCKFSNSAWLCKTHISYCQNKVPFKVQEKYCTIDFGHFGWSMSQSFLVLAQDINAAWPGLATGAKMAKKYICRLHRVSTGHENDSCTNWKLDMTLAPFCVLHCARNILQASDTGR